MSHSETIIAQATPPGRGGVGILRISGQHARDECVAAAFRDVLVTQLHDGQRQQYHDADEYLEVVAGDQGKDLEADRLAQDGTQDEEADNAPVDIPVQQQSL